MKVYNLLLKLIEKKYYEKEVIVNKINFFYAMSQISEEEYSTLMLKIEEVYFVEVQATEETAENAESVENVDNTEESEVM